MIILIQRLKKTLNVATNSIDYKIERFYQKKKSLSHGSHQHEQLENKISATQLKLLKFYLNEGLSELKLKN